MPARKPAEAEFPSRPRRLVADMLEERMARGEPAEGQGHDSSARCPASIGGDGRGT